MTALPDPRRITDAIRTLNSVGSFSPTAKRSTADRLGDELLELRRRCDTGSPSPDGFPSGGWSEGGRSSDRSSSTERAALNDRDTNDPVYDLTQSAAAHLIEAAAHVKAWEHAMALLPTVTDVRPRIGQREALCDSLDEQDDPCAGTVFAKGKCKPCYQWLLDHKDVGVVERSVVSKRKLKANTKAKAYSSGPFAEEAS